MNTGRFEHIDTNMDTKEIELWDETFGLHYLQNKNAKLLATTTMIPVENTQRQYKAACFSLFVYILKNKITQKAFI